MNWVSFDGLGIAWMDWLSLGFDKWKEILNMPQVCGRSSVSDIKFILRATKSSPRVTTPGRLLKSIPLRRFS